MLVDLGSIYIFILIPLVSSIKGVVRKRIVPFTTIKPENRKGNFEYLQSQQREVMEALIGGDERFLFGVGLGAYSSRLLEKQCKMIVMKGKGTSSPKSMQKVEGEEGVKEKKIGDVICVDEAGIVGLALIRFEELLTPDSLSVVLSEEGGSGESPGGGRVDVYTFMPSWWPELDPITDKPLLTRS